MTGQDLLTALAAARRAAAAARPLVEVRPVLDPTLSRFLPLGWRCPDCGCTWPHPVDATDCACDDATGGALTAPSHTQPPTT